mgnify:CR=1 FL=1
MKQAFLNAFSLIFFGFKLPYFVWNQSKKKLSEYAHKSHEEMLDHEYIVTSWLDWAIDCIIFLIYPLCLITIISIAIFTKKVAVLLGLIPIYFFPTLISYVRELGGSLMLLHLNIRAIEKNTHKNEN